MLSVFALMAGVHYFVDVASQPGPGADKATAFLPSDGEIEGMVILQAGATYGLAGIGTTPAPIPRASAGAGMDPEIRRKAEQLRKRYADRLSRMSTRDKLRALNKASKLLGTDARGLTGR